MLKKLVVLGVIGFVAVVALGGTKLASYIRSEISSARERAEANIPPEKEIERLRNEIKLLDKDILTVINEVAKQRVAVNELQEQTDVNAAKQSKALADLKARGEAIKAAEGHVTFGTKTVSVADAKADLEADANRYLTNQKSLDTLQTLLANRIKVRDSLEKQLETMKLQKSELTNAVNDLEAQLAALKLQQMESKYQTDDTRMAKIKEDLRKLKTKLDVKREELKLMPIAMEPTSSTPTAAPTNGKSVDDILAPLNAPKRNRPEDNKMPVVD